eukprot:Em0517g1a
MSTELKRHLDSLGYSHPPVDEEFRRFMASSTNTWDTPDAHTRFARAFLQDSLSRRTQRRGHIRHGHRPRGGRLSPGSSSDTWGDTPREPGGEELGTTLLRKAEVQTTTAAEYAARVKDSYSHGTYRCGPLLQLSFDLLERCPFLALTLPWGPLCSLGLAQRNVSDDGPILWVRPGEQMIPTGELGPTPKKKRNTGAAELQSLYGSRTNERRETLFEDRTHCHADHVVLVPRGRPLQP